MLNQKLPSQNETQRLLKELNFLSEEAVKEFMRVAAFIGLLAFGLNAFAELNFVEYVKRNHKVLKQNVEMPQTTAFKEINPYRGVASMTDEAPESSSSEKSSEPSSLKDSPDSSSSSGSSSSELNK